MTDLNVNQPKLTRKDFASDQDVRWCPGCGDYAILSQTQKVMPELGVPRENIVFISGIGCSSRFPYYMNTYGMHSIHGRAPTIATGLKLANPELKVFVITGDGDGLSIGGNHLLHAMRRNVDLTIILFNNRIYGLTKGQYSPTSLPGTRTKSSPMGSIETNLNPISVAISSEATFVARTVDTHVQHLAEILRQAAEHKGISFVEVLQNCPIFNDGAWEAIKNPRSRNENALTLEHGEPMIFDKGRKGIVINGFTPKIVDLEKNPDARNQVVVHDEAMASPALAFMLSRFEAPEFPIPIGVFRKTDAPTYESQVMSQIQTAKEDRGEGDLYKLFTQGDTWNVQNGNNKSHSMHPGDVLPLQVSENADEYTDTMGTPQPDPSQVQTHMSDDTLGSLTTTTDLMTVTAETSLADAIDMMQSRDLGCMLIVDDDGKLVGIFTERDVLNRVATQVEDLTGAVIGDYMTKDVRTMPAETPIAYGVSLMATNGFRHVPLVDQDNHPVGIVSFRDVVHFIDSKEN